MSPKRSPSAMRLSEACMGRRAAGNAGAGMGGAMAPALPACASKGVDGRASTAAPRPETQEAEPTHLELASSHS